MDEQGRQRSGFARQQLSRGFSLLHRLTRPLAGIGRYFKPVNGIQWITLILVALVAAGAVYGYQTQNNGLRTLICQVQSAELRSPKLTPHEKVKIVHFWSTALSNLREPACSTK